MVADRALLDLLARQDGLITTAKAAWCGLPGRALQRRAHDEGWRQVAPRVFLAGGHRLTWPDPRRRPVGRGPRSGLRAGRGLVARDAPGSRHPDRRDRPPPARSARLPRRPGPPPRPPALDTVVRNGIWCTAAPLTVLETAIALPDGSAFLDRALQEHVRFEHLYQAYCRNMGSRGAARAAALLTGGGRSRRFRR